jgi:plastocyanin
MRPRRPLALAVLAAAAAGSGCGAAAQLVRAPDAHVSVVLDDFSISPQRIQARSGRLTFTAVDRGRLPHSLRVRRGDRDLLTITTLLPGARGEGSVTLSRGAYKLYCAIGNHEELGMWGTLVVR